MHSDIQRAFAADRARLESADGSRPALPTGRSAVQVASAIAALRGRAPRVIGVEQESRAA